MTMSKRTASTLADVAAAAGVSRSTASRALNDSPRISEATKQRIRDIAHQINFVPNARGRALAVGRSETIAVLVTEPLSELFSDPTYGAFLSGITEQLSESEYLPVLLQASTPHERERVVRHFERRSFDAVIDISPYRGSELLDVLRDLEVPTVLCGQLEGHPYRDVFSTVYSDDVEGAALAARAMVNRGRTNCVAILGPKDNPAVIDRVRGYTRVLGEALPEDLILYTGWSASDGFLAMRHLLERGVRPDGVLAGSDRIASGVIEALRDYDLLVPRDVSVIGFDDHPIATKVTPRLTTIRQPLHLEGSMAADMALELIDGAEPTTTVLHMELIERESL
ncbi:LacI family DNA-binding transcriptional regulator [Collinsella tanakaei]|uniref:LacI family DNA-binding transcriptional regulator n=1 Tax=Collinsella tanakaei TaxID=626935 RepID=UPI001F3BC664|nr:LacI family DNA-binding transcriptional regulator [Collinsella tanakaei]MCF2622340.1 LacI family DNA-binding transcriptional regulator [Collinsella tanakaei]